MHINDIIRSNNILFSVCSVITLLQHVTFESCFWNYQVTWVRYVHNLPTLWFVYVGHLFLYIKVIVIAVGSSSSDFRIYCTTIHHAYTAASCQHQSLIFGCSWTFLWFFCIGVSHNIYSLSMSAFSFFKGLGSWRRWTLKILLTVSRWKARRSGIRKIMQLYI